MCVTLLTSVECDVSERKPHADLRGKGNADGSAGAEEIAKAAGRNRQLIES